MASRKKTKSTAARQTFVCLDTNILFRVVTQGQPGCELQHFDEIRKLVDRGNTVFLLPEVVLLEFESLTRWMEDDFTLQGKKLEASLSRHLESEKRWNEVADVVPFLRAQVVAWTERKLRETKERCETLHEWLLSKASTLLPLSEEIYFKRYRRVVAGRFPKREARPVEDCCIVESLIKFFEDRDQGEGQLLLCTENLADFGIEWKDKKEKSDEPDELHAKHTLHPVLADGLPLTEVLTSLDALAGFLKERKKVEKPTPDVLKDALEREKVRDFDAALEAEALYAGWRQLQMTKRSLAGSWR